MIIEDFTPAQRIIIKKICILQLDSLRRLLYNESDMDLDLEMFLIENEISREEYDKQLIENISKFKKLTQNPDDLRVLDEYDLSKFRHILATLENKFNAKFPKAVSNLWQRLFMIERISETKQFTFQSN